MSEEERREIKALVFEAVSDLTLPPLMDGPPQIYCPAPPPEKPKTLAEARVYLKKMLDTNWGEDY